MKDLTEDEVVDLALSVQTISALMEAKHNADSVTVSIQVSKRFSVKTGLGSI